MKKWISILLCLVLVIAMTGCGNNNSANKPASEQSAAKNNTTDKVPVLLDQEEYLLYQNVFYNDYGKQLVGSEVTKHGVFAVIQDAFDQCTRYYAWGYMDNTKCCDWQWEFVPQDPDSLPAPGSLISVKGEFTASEDSLDGYWIENGIVETDTIYVGETFELNMRTMSCTLERVQMLNILYRPDYFKKQTFAAYGRIAAPGMLEDPYYNGSWQIDFAPEGTSLAIGTQVILQGSVIDGKLSDCTVTKAE